VRICIATALVLVLLAWTPAGGKVQAQPAARPARARSTRWSSSGAPTMSRGRWELGLLHGLRWGAREDLELGLHPILFFVLPHLEAKVHWRARGSWHLGTRHRLSYPSLFLQLVSREGDLGLLPATTRVPVAIGLDNDVLLSVEVGSGHLLTAEAGLSTAPRLTPGDELPLLDFPFLYSRFAALKTAFTAYAGVGAEGTLLDVLAYRLDVDLNLLPVIPGGYTVEQGASLGWRPSDHFELSAGYRICYGRYPVGERFHYLPFLDVKGGF
jgi:hypothetical protein